ncbi:MAG: SpoIIE family protein phosphatase [Huintestinicola sp.]
MAANMATNTASDPKLNSSEGDTAASMRSEQSCGETEEYYDKFTAAAAALFALFTGFLITNVHIGAMLSPFAVSLAAASPPLCGAAAFIGSFAAIMTGGSIYSSLTELISMGAMLFFSYFYRRHVSIYVTASAAAAVYIICGFAVSFGTISLTLGAAIVIRGIMCGIMTVFFGSFIQSISRNGIDLGKNSLTLVSAAAVYILLICAMCGKAAAVFNLGRFAAGFATCAAARKFGMKGGAAVGIASGAAFLLSDISLGRCGSMLAFGGMAAGLCSQKGKHSVNIAFICSCFGITAAAGLPSGTPEFIADMGAAAAAYCLIPEKLYIPYINSIVPEKKQDMAMCSDKLRFAAGILEDVKNDVGSAAFILAGKRQAARDIAKNALGQKVRECVCGGRCSQLKCSAVGGDGRGNILGSDFSAAQAAAERKGMLTEKDLPTGFEGCTKKQDIVSEFNSALRIRSMQQRSDAFVKRFLDGVTEQISASREMMTVFAEEIVSEYTVNAPLSETAEAILKALGLSTDSIAVMTDSCGRYFAECYISGTPRASGKEILSDSDFYGGVLATATDRLSAYIGAELDMPVVTRLTPKDGKPLTRIRWCERTVYSVECSALCYAAESGISGDSHTSFEDGRGNYYVILSDGMGRGGRAAAQSGMSVNILRRLITAGICDYSAVKILNTFLSAADCDEIFTTADILKISCYDGKCSLIKLGSASTYVRTADENGIMCTEVLEAYSAPMGIITVDSITEHKFTLDEHSRTVLVTDGITPECATYISELLENEKLTPEQTAEKIMAYSDETECSDSEKMRLRDDKTSIAVRLYRKFPS